MGEFMPVGGFADDLAVNVSPRVEPLPALSSAPYTNETSGLTFAPLPEIDRRAGGRRGPAVSGCHEQALRTEEPVPRRPRGPGPLGPGAGHAADAVAVLPAGVQRSRLPDPRRAPAGPAAARAPEDRDGAGGARHRLDGRDARERADPRPGAARSRPTRSAGSPPYYEQAREFARLGTERALSDRQPRERRLHRRRPRDHGGRQPRRGRGRRRLDQPQHRAAARAGRRTATARRS